MTAATSVEKRSSPAAISTIFADFAVVAARLIPSAKVQSLRVSLMSVSYEKGDGVASYEAGMVRENPDFRI